MSYNGKQFSFKSLQKKAHLSDGGNSIEIINYTRGGIVMFFTEKKGNAFFGGQIQVLDAGPGADWLS